MFGTQQASLRLGEMPALTNSLSLRESQVSLMNLLKYFIIGWHAPEGTNLPEKATPTPFTCP